MLALRAEAKKARVASIAESDAAITVSWHADAPPDPSAPARWLQKFGPRLSFVPSSEGDSIRLKLAEYEWNISRTAQALGIERTNLHKKLRALGIHRSDTDSGT